MRSALLSLFVLAITAQAQFLAPTNPAPSVALGWTPPADATGIIGFYVYFGTASGQYTNKVFTGSTSTFVPLTRDGSTFYFAVTSTDGNLESDFSNEISYKPKTKPGKPTMNIPGTFTVQTKVNGGDWVDLLDLPVPLDASNQLFRTRIGPALAMSEVIPMSAQERALRALHAVPRPPGPK